MSKKVIKETMTLDTLAGMVKHGFDDVDKNLGKVNGRIGTLETKIGTLETKMNGRMDTLENGIEEIKLKLDQVAYRFELEELARRVRRLEMKAGMK